MLPLKQYIHIIGPLILLMIISEIIWAWRLKKKTVKEIYNAKESASNIFILIGTRLAKNFFTLWTLTALTYVSQYKLFDLKLLGDAVWVTVLGIIIIDFFYYWQHRINHEVRFFWTMHHIHHSSPWMNLTTAVRLNWVAPIFSPLFFIPATLCGVAVEHIILFFTLNLLYQFWLHTQAIGKFGILEGIFNTPSAHRVHHGTNKLYIDKNYGGILMIWDRMFGTYAPETEEVKYGVTTGFQGHNPFKALFSPMVKFFMGTFKREKQVTSS